MDWSDTPEGKEWGKRCERNEAAESIRRVTAKELGLKFRTVDILASHFDTETITQAQVARLTKRKLQEIIGKGVGYASIIKWLGEHGIALKDPEYQKYLQGIADTLRKNGWKVEELS